MMFPKTRNRIPGFFQDMTFGLSVDRHRRVVNSVVVLSANTGKVLLEVDTDGEAKAMCLKGQTLSVIVDRDLAGRSDEKECTIYNYSVLSGEEVSRMTHKVKGGTIGLADQGRLRVGQMEDRRIIIEVTMRMIIIVGCESVVADVRWFVRWCSVFPVGCWSAHLLSRTDAQNKIDAMVLAKLDATLL